MKQPNQSSSRPRLSGFSRVIDGLLGSSRKADNDSIDWSKSTEEVAREVIREGEAYLSSQVQLAIAGDQRASVMASVFAAAGAVIAAALMTLASTDQRTLDFPIYVGGTVAALMFLAGAAFCVWACMPVRFHLPGASPGLWREDIETGRSLFAALGEQAKNYQDQIEDNDSVLATNTRRFTCGATVGIAAPFLGAAAFATASLFHFA